MKKSRNRQLDFKSEEVHQSDTYCPSVERALFKECKLEELLVESQLKKAGIQTAQALIQILYEEIRSLKGQKQTLETQISIMLRQFSEKEEHLKRQIAFLQNDLRQVVQMRQLKAAQMRDINSRSSLSKCFLPNSSRKLSVPKSYKSIEKKGEQKSQYHESPIRKMSLVETVSKEYVQQEYEMGAKICQDTVAAFLSDDVERLVVDFEEISNFLKDEKDELTEYVNRHEQNERKVKQLSKELKSPLKDSLKMYQNSQLQIKHQPSNTKPPHNKQLFKKKKLFTTQNSNQASPNKVHFLCSWEDRIKQQSKRDDDISTRQLIKQYEDIIQQYKQYSAYLRAYLCSCISFISKSTKEMVDEKTALYCLQSERLKNSQQSQCLSTDRSNNIINFPSNRVFQVVLKDILTTVEDKIQMEHQIRRQVEEENKELRSILDQLVENLKKSGIKANNSKSSSNRKSYESRETYEMRSPQQYSRGNNEKVRSKQFERTQSKYHSSSVKKRDSVWQTFNRPYKKFNQPPKIHRITLTQYKRYNNQEQ